MAEIALAAQRYDDGGGNGTFTGCIPLKPGQLFEAALGTVSLYRARPLVQRATPSAVGASPSAVAARSSIVMRGRDGEVPATIKTLYPQHPDGSMKVAFVHATLDLADGVEQTLVLKIGTAPTGIGPTKVVVNREWMKFPRLLGCTDSAHMCQARVAFGPLVPVNDPRLVALPNWHAFVTTELENATTSGTQGFPTYKRVLADLATRGDLGIRSGVFTPGSDVVTGIEGGNWPLPSSPQIGDAVVGMTVAANDGGFGGIFNTTAAKVGTTTIVEILGPDSVRLAHVVNPDWTAVPRRYVAAWGSVFAAGNANYNAAVVLFYRYLTAASGHLDKLRTALQLLQDRYHDSWSFTIKGGPTVATNESGGGSITRGTGTAAQAYGRYNSPYTDEDGVVHVVNEPFPLDEFGQPLNTNTAGDREDRSGFHQTAYLGYLLSGWMQALGNVIGFGFGGLAATAAYVPFPGYPWQPDSVLLPTQQGGTSGFHTPSQQGSAGARLNFRLRREGELFYYMLSLPFDLNANPQAGPRMAPSPRNPAMREKWMTFWQRYVWDSVDLWSREQAPGHWQYGLWGFSSWYNDTPVAGSTANFQLQMAFNMLATLYMNVREDSRFPTKMGELAVFFAEQQNLVPPTKPEWAGGTLGSPSAVARASNPPVFRLPYLTTDPAILATDDADPAGYYARNLWTTTILLALLTYGWRVTGNAKLLQMIDGHCTTYSQTLDINASLGQPPDQKVNGETFHMAFYAAAWRVGENWGLVSEGTGL